MAEQRPAVAPESVRNAFRPQIAVFASQDVDDIARDNGLNSIVELLKPWEKSIERVTLRTATFASHVVPTFPLLLTEAKDLCPSGLDAAFLDALSQSISEKTAGWIEAEASTDLLDGGANEVEDAATTPWFDLYRDTLLEQRPCTEYETFGHPVSCLLMVSTAHPEPLNAFADLYERTTPDKLFPGKPYIDGNILRFYVLVHDLRQGSPQDLPLLNDVRKTYGLHHSMLLLNTETVRLPDSAYASASDRPPAKAANFADHWSKKASKFTLKGPAASAETSEARAFGKVGQHLGEEDVRNIKAFLREFAVQSLIPYMERNIAQWNEQLIAARKGIANRFLSAGRKYFGSRPASPANAAAALPSFDAAAGFYPSAAAEAQTRRLADFAFMLADYRLAGSCYDLARKDNLGDKAWRYFASAARMQALTELIIAAVADQGAINTDACLEATSSSVPTVATQLDELRYSAAAYCVLANGGYHQEAAKIMMGASRDLEDLPAAILLDQAARSHAGQSPQIWRKPVMFWTLSSHRYHRSGHRRLAQRCCDLALRKKPVTSSRWAASYRHLQAAAGELSYQLGQRRSALRHLSSLLHTAGGEDPPAKLLIALETLRLATKLPDATADGKSGSPESLDMPTSIFRTKSSRIIVDSATSQLDLATTAWRELERVMLTRGYPYTSSRGELRAAPAALLRSQASTIVSICSSFYLEIQAVNPLNVELELHNVSLALEGRADAVTWNPVDVVSFAPSESKTIRIELFAQKLGACRLDSITYDLFDGVSFAEKQTRRGKRLYSTKAQLLSPTYAEDRSLSISVLKATSSLVVELSDAGLDLLHGQETIVRMKLRATGTSEITDIRMMTNMPQALVLEQTDFAPVSDQQCNPVVPADPVFTIAEGSNLPFIGPLDIAVRLRGDWIGERTVQMLFTYIVRHGERVEESCTTASCIVTCRPSIELATRTHFSSQEISLGLYNASNDSIVITQILSVSAGGISIESPASTEKYLSSRQRYTSMLSIRERTAAQNSLNGTTATHEALAAVLEKQAPQAPAVTSHGVLTITPYEATGLFSLPLLCAAEGQARSRQLQQQFGKASEVDVTRMFPIFRHEEMTLVLLWQKADGSRVGWQHSTVRVAPRHDTTRTLFAIEQAGGSKGEQGAAKTVALKNAIASSELAAADCPITIRPDHKPFQSSFGGNGCVLYHLCNQSAITANVTLDLLGTREAQLNMMPPVQWVGRKRLTAAVAAYSSAELTAYFRRPASIADAGLWDCTIKQAGLKWVLSGSLMPVLAT